MCVFDPQLPRQQLPAIAQSAFIYLDNAATTPMPQAVIDTLINHHTQQVGNVHRGQHQAGQATTLAFEQARQTVANFINATSKDEIIWTRGTTESLNLIANLYGQSHLSPKDEILISIEEHHANFVPWQQIVQQTGATLRILPHSIDEYWDQEAFENAVNANTKIVALAHITNVLGNQRPIKRIIEKAHQVGAIVVLDGAQGIQHEHIDVKALGVDFYVFSGHKLFGPTGIGVLYGKYQYLESLPPWQFGGKMVKKVTVEGTQFAPPPARFEAGTPNIGGALALASAIQWHQQWDHHAVQAHINRLHQQLHQGLSQIDGVKILSLKANQSGILTFIVEGEHPDDIATLLDQQRIILRSGHHCTHPLHNALKVKGTLRFSLALYNTEDDVNKAIHAVQTACNLF
jgi:cysteine sulfinate desulfinase